MLEVQDVQDVQVSELAVFNLFNLFSLGSVRYMQSNHVATSNNLKHGPAARPPNKKSLDGLSKGGQV